jgi:hypothetical protein
MNDLSTILLQGFLFGPNTAGLGLVGSFLFIGGLEMLAFLAYCF